MKVFSSPQHAALCYSIGKAMQLDQRVQNSTATIWDTSGRRWGVGGLEWGCSTNIGNFCIKHHVLHQRLTMAWHSPQMGDIEQNLLSSPYLLTEYWTGFQKILNLFCFYLYAFYSFTAYQLLLKHTFYTEIFWWSAYNFGQKVGQDFWSTVDL